jgi:hypothetical protein
VSRIVAAPFVLAVLGLAACGGGSSARARAVANSVITIEYMELEPGTLGLSLGGRIGINQTFAGVEDDTLDELSVLMVHELWHELISLDHVERGCYAAAELTTRWGAPLCEEERRRWLTEPAPGNYLLRILDPGLELCTQRAAAFITAEATQGRVTFSIARGD